MVRIIVAGASKDAREQLSRVLASSGNPPFRQCASESELRRALDMSEDCILILAGLLPGLQPDDLVWDYGQRVRILLIAKPAVLNRSEAEGVFRLTLPTTGQAVTGAVEMLIQLHQMSLPRRTGADRQTVEEAKRILMEQEGFTEQDAHRYLQQYAMNHGMKMADCAARLVASSRGMK